jgi:hypothetical protein
MLHPNQVAYSAATAVFDAAHDLELTVRGTKVRVMVERQASAARPRLSDDSEVPGLDDSLFWLIPENPWLPTLVLHCSWNGGAIDLGLRLMPWRSPGIYQGDLALHIATLPSNREIVWMNLSKRIDNAQKQNEPTCTIPGSFSLWTRTGESDARPFTQALGKDALDAGLRRLSSTQFEIFEIDTIAGDVQPLPSEIFNRLVLTALIKLPYVTRGERSDIRGTPPFTISGVARQEAETPQLVPREILGGSSSVPEPTAESSQENVFFTYLQCAKFGPFEEFVWNDIAKLNVIVGANDTGKSHLLKLMYALARGVEDFTARIDSDKPTWAKVLAEKMVWTFEPHEGKVGNLVHRGANAAIVHGTLCNEDYPFSFGPKAGADASDFADVSKEIRPQPNLHAVFIPPKEVLTSLNAIALVRERRTFGFDDTYVDLVRALRLDPVQAVLPMELQRVLDNLDKLLGGRIVTEQGRFFFERDGEKYGMTHTAEGIKKIGILARLIENAELRRNTILFLDEPEVNLHPKAARALVRMLVDLSQAGVQIFVATHSYFVLKQFEILARQKQESVMLCSLERNQGGIEASFADLRKGLPETAIGQESLDLYDEDVAVSWKEDV